jgi:hypothetical protein
MPGNKCFTQPFEIKIDNSSSVTELKSAIKEANIATFRDTDVMSITLWKVSIPLRDCLAGDIKDLRLDHRNSLPPNVILSDLFEFNPATNLNCVHIIVDRLPSPSQSYLLANHPYGECR